MGYSPQKITIIPCVADYEFFHLAPAQRQQTVNLSEKNSTSQPMSLFFYIAAPWPLTMRLGISWIYLRLLTE
jgi:hypothetical protein